MQLILLLIGIMLSFSFVLRAQEASVFKVKAGEIVTQVIPLQERYHYNEFQQGTVFFRNGKSLPALLNYHLLYREMQFIDPKGDTLALVEDYSLKNIRIRKELFYQVYKFGYLEVFAHYPLVNLARKQNLEIIASAVKLVGASNSAYVGGSGMNGTNSSGSTYTPGFSYRKLYTQKAPGEIYLEKQTSYFFMDKNERFFQAKKSILLKLFGRHKRLIEQYLKKNQPDFTKEEDLKNLLEFCSQLAGE